MKQSTIIWIAAAVSLTAIASIIVALLYLKPATVHTNTHTTATAAPEIVHVKHTKVTVNDCTVSVYHAGAKTELELSTEDKTNKAKHVVAASRVDSSRYDHTVTTLLDSGTGKFNTLVREEPLPKFRFRNSGYIGLGYGIKPGTGTTVRLMGGADFVQVRAWHLGVTGTLDSDGQAFVGGSAVRRW